MTIKIKGEKNTLHSENALMLISGPTGVMVIIFSFFIMSVSQPKLLNFPERIVTWLQHESSILCSNGELRESGTHSA